MSDDAEPAAPEVEIRQWRALRETAAKAVNKFAKDLPDDQKVVVKPGDVLRARVVRREPDNVIIADGLLNGVPLPANISIIHKAHWQRIEEPVPPPAEPQAAAAEPTPEELPVETPPAEAPPAVFETAEAPPEDPPRPEKQPTARRLRAWFLKKRGG